MLVVLEDQILLVLLSRWSVGEDSSSLPQNSFWPSALVSNRLPRRPASSVGHRPHLLAGSVLCGSVRAPPERRDASEKTDLRSGEVCSAVQPLAERLVLEASLLLCSHLFTAALALQKIQCTCRRTSCWRSTSRVTMEWYTWARKPMSLGDPGRLVRYATRCSATCRPEHAHPQCCFWSVWTRGPGGLPEASAGQPSAPEWRWEGLHGPSRSRLPQQGGLCHGEKPRTYKTSLNTGAPIFQRLLLKVFESN